MDLDPNVLKLQALLEAILGSNEVHFQPPADVRMNYPAIVYARTDEDVKHADNKPYSRKKKYSVTVIDRNPHSRIPDKVGALPLSRFATHFKSDNLNHDVYNIYF